jgi:flagellar basal body-associated protein FliL
MKKSRYVILFLSAFIIIIVATIAFINNIGKDDYSNAGEQNVKEAQITEDHEIGIETIKTNEYTIQLRGSARQKNDEISVEEAADIGVEALKKEYDIEVKNEIDMIFLDDVLTNSGTWSGHYKLNDTEEYEFLIDGKDGSLEFIDRNE